MRIYEQKNILERNINYSNAYGRNLLQEAIVSCENTISSFANDKSCLTSNPMHIAENSTIAKSLPQLR